MLTSVLRHFRPIDSLPYPCPHLSRDPARTRRNAPRACAPTHCFPDAHDDHTLDRACPRMLWIALIRMDRGVLGLTRCGGSGRRERRAGPRPCYCSARPPAECALCQSHRDGCARRPGGAPPPRAPWPSGSTPAVSGRSHKGRRAREDI